jgi:hypothetical protein
MILAGLHKPEDPRIGEYVIERAKGALPGTSTRGFRNLSAGRAN